MSHNIGDPLMKAIMKYRFHSSIVAIKKNCNSGLSFNFSQVERHEIMKEINNLKTNKATQSTDIPTKLIKENSDIFGDFIFGNYNNCVSSSIFPNFLKNAIITPVHKKGAKSSKDNYRPVSTLSNLSKIYKRLLFKQISEYFEPILSKFQYGFRKGYSAQHCLLAMLEKWKLAVDSKRNFGALLTDLFKAFDCLPHDLLLAKLNAYGFSLPALRLVQSYLSNRKQRTKINLEFSPWEEILFGVPQGSVLGPLLFNIFLCDLFFIMNDVEFASYADDNTPFFVGDDLNDVILKLQNASKTLFKWFNDNQMKANPDKCHFICSSSVKTSIMIENKQIRNSSCEKLLGVLFDSKLTFQSHNDNICKKASQKLNAISSITPYMDLNKKRLAVNAFSIAQFNYCPLIWMCHNRTYNNKINRLHERCLRLIYNDKRSSFEDLLEKDNSVSINHKNLQALAIEMFKVYTKTSPEIMQEVFQVKEQGNYNLRNQTDFIIPEVKSVNHGLESVRFLGPKIWESLPNDLKNKESADSFKTTIKRWKPESCPCRLCKTYLQNIGYL